MAESTGGDWHRGKGSFACRQFCDLRYSSQRKDDGSRALSKARAIRLRLGGSDRMDQEFPDKPKRMRWNTYRLLRAQSQEFWIESLQAALGGSVTARGDAGRVEDGRRY